jgi:hypothetical protein
MEAIGVEQAVSGEGVTWSLQDMAAKDRPISPYTFRSVTKIALKNKHETIQRKSASSTRCDHEAKSSSG